MESSIMCQHRLFKLQGNDIALHTPTLAAHPPLHHTTPCLASCSNSRRDMRRVNNTDVGSKILDRGCSLPRLRPLPQLKGRGSVRDHVVVYVV
jgi:hypothetical protein